MVHYRRLTGRQFDISSKKVGYPDHVSIPGCQMGSIWRIRRLDLVEEVKKVTSDKNLIETFIEQLCIFSSRVSDEPMEHVDVLVSLGGGVTLMNPGGLGVHYTIAIGDRPNPMEINAESWDAAILCIRHMFLQNVRSATDIECSDCYL